MAKQTKREEKLQQVLCRLIRLQHPKAQFNSDSSGIKLSIGQAKQMQSVKSGRGFPDFVLYVRRMGFGALFLELKKEGENPYKKDGTLKASRVVTKDGRQHLQLQQEKILQLREAGYFAAFVVGLDNAIKAVEAYMKEDLEKLVEVTCPGFDAINQNKIK